MLKETKTEKNIGEMTDEEIFSLSLTKPNFFEEIVRRYKKAFLRKAGPIVAKMGGINMTEDVVQETFIKIYIKGKSFVSQGNGSFRSWAYVVLLNTCYSAYRKAKKEKTISLDEYEEALLNIPDLAKTEESKISFDFALSLISKLPAKLYKTAHQYFLEGKSQKEIALAEGTTDGAIRTRIHRARNFIEKLSKKTEKEGT
jgi:RNA polymerase sigma-70 factor (ECF subfamily)